MGARSAILGALAKLFIPDATGDVELGQSPAQFDNSLRLATTAFAQAAGLHFPIRAGIGINATMTLTAAQMNGWGQIQVAGITVTLPSLASLPAGTTFTITASENATIKGSGTDSILTPTGTSGNAINVRVGETITFVANGATGNWYVVQDGFGLAAFNQASFAGNGYQKLPNGFIFQWGGNSVAGTGFNDVVPLPISFTSAFLGGSISDAGNGIHSCAIVAASLSSITCCGGIPAGSPQYASTSYRFFVVGI